MTDAEPDPVACLMQVHYGFFMSNPQFWYDRDLREADAIVCTLASEIRRGAQVKNSGNFSNEVCPE
jgi:hypothetical protein